jgi:hypothetical protein
MSTIILWEEFCLAPAHHRLTMLSQDLTFPASLIQSLQKL